MQNASNGLGTAADTSPGVLEIARVQCGPEQDHRHQTPGAGKDLSTESPMQQKRFLAQEIAAWRGSVQFALLERIFASLAEKNTEVALNALGFPKGEGCILESKVVQEVATDLA